MPELPEVQTVCNDLVKANVIGLTIKKAEVFWPRIIDSDQPDKFCQEIKNKKILEIKRRAKYIHILLKGGYHLFIHLRMSGRLSINDDKEAISKHEHVVLHLDNKKQLRYHDTRKFGRWSLTKDPEAIIGKLGIEPFSKEFTVAWLEKNIKTKKRQMKPLLLDQSFIAGIGNIYADESLFLAGIHPESLSSEVSKNQIKLLHKGIRSSLTQGLKNLGTSLGNSQANFYSVANRRGRNKDRLKVFRRHGEPCPTCDTIIKRIQVAQRSTHFCPKCQR